MATPVAAPAPISLVIIDDNPRSLEMLEAALSREGLRILTASDPEDGLELVYQQHPQIVLTDLVMPKLSGLDVLERIMEFDPATDVILMTAHYTTESAVEAIRKGAADYLNKPVSLPALEDRINHLVQEARRRQRALALEDELRESCQFEGIIGRSPLMWNLFARVRRVAPHYRTVLITGETGTGKDLIARALHTLSPVAKGPFVVLNCAAVVETLFESELFGHVRGAFTGADRDKVGLVEHAHGGTLFLDEIGDMPLATQAKLLRTLQSGEVQRVGALSTRRVDLHVIAATHRNLREAMLEREFREDLYYRLSMVEVRAPRLADRKEDLPLLIRHFVKVFSKTYGRSIQGLTHRAHLVLARHDWPGNVRELENVMGHACMMALGDTIDVQDLPEYLQSPQTREEVSGSTASPDAVAPLVPTGVGALQEQERALVTRALEQASGNQSEAARLLRIGRDALRYKMKKYNLL